MRRLEKGQFFYRSRLISVLEGEPLLLNIETALYFSSLICSVRPFATLVDAAIIATLVPSRSTQPVEIPGDAPSAQRHMSLQ